MAAKARNANPRFVCTKTGLGKRNVEVKAVGAWVQPACHRENVSQDAVVSAAFEEERMQQQQREKQERLQRFQEDVKKRVQTLQKLKRQEMLEKSYKAVEVERSVVIQSATSAERITPRKNSCSVRNTGDLSIKHSAQSNTRGGIISHVDNEEAPSQFEEHNSQVINVKHQARRNLSSRRLMTEKYSRDELPGGFWKSGPAMENTVAELENESDDVVIEEVYCANEIPADLEGRSVRFDRDPSPGDTRASRIRQKSATTIHGSEVVRAVSVPNIYPGVSSEEEKQQERNQRAMYRRLFMDIEREQVKENQKRQQHRKKINQLKKYKEEERQAVENQAQLIVEPKDPMTGETACESFEREMKEELDRQQVRKAQQERAQKTKDSERFLEALRINLREKITNAGIELPRLCCCGESVWDTNPSTCANNCVFYRNPKAYAKALQSLLASIES